MSIQHSAGADFWRSYHDLPKAIRIRADKQIALLKTDSHHPSLHFKRVGEQDGSEIWSARITLKYRALAIRRPAGYLWFWIGDHKTYDALIA